MRNNLFFFFLTVVTLINAQAPAEIILADGSKFEGFADITKKDEIEFRIVLEDEPDVLDGLDVKRLQFTDYPNDTYEFVYIKNRFKLLKLIAEGSINAYAQYPESFSTQKSEGQKKREDYINHERKVLGNGMSMYPGGGLNLRQRRYYVKHSETEKVDDIKLNFRQEARVWFKDCPEVVEYTDSKEWQYEDLKIIVEFYNEFCGQN